MTLARGSMGRRLFLIAVALLITGCTLDGGDSLYSSNTAGGGGEDFPNTVTRLGKIAAADVAASKDWEALQNLELPEVPAISLDSLRIEPPVFKRASLAKTDASAECVAAFWTWDITEFLYQRQIRKITCTQDVATVRRDTLFYHYAGGALPATREELEAKPDSFVTLIASSGSITWPQLGKVQYFRATSLDSTGGLDHGEFLTVQAETGGTSVVQRVKVYGPDGAYLSPTAAPEEFEYTRLSATGDTLEWKRMRDADGDRAFWDGTRKGLVSFERIVRSPDNEPGTARLSLFMKARLTHDTMTGDNLERLYYRDARLLQSGRTTAFSFIGDAPDSLLRAQDTAIVTSDTVFAAQDSMSGYHGVYRLLLGLVPEEMSGHALIGFGIDKTWRRGPLRHSITGFTPSAPMTGGRDSAFTGVMEFLGAYANRDTIRTTGTVTAQGMEMEYYGVKSGKEESYLLVFDIHGNPVGEPLVIPKPDMSGVAPKSRR